MNFLASVAASLVLFFSILPRGEACFGNAGENNRGGLSTSAPAPTTTTFTGTWTFTTPVIRPPPPKPPNYKAGAFADNAFHLMTSPIWPPLPPIDLTGFGHEDVVEEEPNYETLCYQTDDITVAFDCDAYVSGKECPVGTLSEQNYPWKRSQPTNELLRYYNNQCASVNLPYVRCVTAEKVPVKFPKCRKAETGCLADERQVPADMTFANSADCANYYAMYVCYIPEAFPMCFTDIADCTAFGLRLQPQLAFSFTATPDGNLNDQWDAKWAECREFYQCGNIERVYCANLEIGLPFCRPTETGGCLDGELQVTPVTYPRHADCMSVDMPPELVAPCP